jgi:hypothetical protein
MHDVTRDKFRRGLHLSEGDTTAWTKGGTEALRHVEKNCKMKGDDRKRSLFCWYHPNNDPPQRTVMQRNYLRDTRSAEKKRTDNDKTTRRSRRCTSCPISTTTIIHHHSSSPSHLVNHSTSPPLSGRRETKSNKEPRRRKNAREKMPMRCKTAPHETFPSFTIIHPHHPISSTTLPHLPLSLLSQEAGTRKRKRNRGATIASWLPTILEAGMAYIS